jgi:hypothetical protein
MLPRSCRSRQVVGGKPGELLARSLLVTFGIGVLLGMGCWTDGAAMQACKQSCLPLPVAKMSAEGCVCFTGCPACGGDDGGTVSR